MDIFNDNRWYRHYLEYGELNMDDLAPPEFFWLGLSYIFTPFIRYIIFGNFDWFPWTSFRKE